MIHKLTYNNRVLSAEERAEFCRISDEYINEFSGYIEGIHQLTKEYHVSDNSDYNKITKTIIDIETFTNYAFCDCIVLNKLFVRATNPYEKSFVRGKLKVQLNESFKRLYGFKKGYKNSFRREYDELLSDLEQISKDPWWKDVRDAEVHINISKLYELRHEEINESKVVMETWQLIELFNRINRFICRLHRAYFNYMTAQFFH